MLGNEFQKARGIDNQVNMRWTTAVIAREVAREMIAASFVGEDRSTPLIAIDTIRSRQPDLYSCPADRSTVCCRLNLTHEEITRAYLVALRSIGPIKRPISIR